MPNLVTIGQTSTGFNLRGSSISPTLLTTLNVVSQPLQQQIIIEVNDSSQIATGDIIVIKNTGLQATYLVQVLSGLPLIPLFWMRAPGDSTAGTNIPNGSSVYSQSFRLQTVQSLNLTNGQQFILSSTNVNLHCSILTIYSGQDYLAQWLGTAGDSGVGSYGVGLNVQTMSGGQTSFTPQKFFVFQGQVWCRDTTGQFYQYGGVAGTSFDTCQATVATPWLDLGKPTTRKTATSVDYAVSGAWTISGSMDFNGVYNLSDNPVQIATTSQTNPTALQGSFQLGEQPWTDEGFHVQFQCTSTDSTSPGAVLSELVFNFEENDAK
jgi:hypothetical protein